MALTDPTRGVAALAEIRRVGGGPAELMLAELSDQGSVRELAQEFQRDHARLHVLVNNAAVFTPEQQATKEGYELMFATNHLGPFLLTNLLLDSLKAGAPARIITVSAPSTTIYGIAPWQIYLAGVAWAVGPALLVLIRLRRLEP